MYFASFNYLYLVFGFVVRSGFSNSMPLPTVGGDTS